MLAPSEPVRRMESRSKRLARRVAVGLASTAMVVTLGGGFLHTKAGRPWMARIFGASCPMNSVTAEQLDIARRGAIAGTRGSDPAPTRPAFGFRLDESTLEEVKAWAVKSGVACELDKPWLMKCSDVPPEALGRGSAEGVIEELALGFTAHGRLVNITTLRRHLTPADGSRMMRAISTAVVTELGAPQSLPAEVASGSVSAEPLSTMKFSLKFSDYLAEVTAMNLPSAGVVVREHYLSARD